MIGTYKAVVTAEFIKYRDEMSQVFNAGIFGADAEFPEHHQAEIDPEQELNESWEYDTYHYEMDSNLDYKMYSQTGIHISKAIQRVIRKGITQKLVIWRWLPFYVELTEGMEVEYEILGIVDAKEALSKLNKENRFNFKLK